MKKFKLYMPGVLFVLGLAQASLANESICYNLEMQNEAHAVDDLLLPGLELEPLHPYEKAAGRLHNALIQDQLSFADKKEKAQLLTKVDHIIYDRNYGDQEYCNKRSRVGVYLVEVVREAFPELGL